MQNHQDKLPQTSTKKTTPGRPPILRQLAAPVAFLICLVLIGQWAGGYWSEVENYIAMAGTSGYLIFMAGFVLLTVACFPVSVLGFSAGVLYGPTLGLGLLFTSGLVSGLLMFWVGRGFPGKRIRVFVESQPKLAAIQKATETHSLRLNFLARLSPLNYGLVCYTLAVSKTSFRNYVLGLLAILPSMIAQVWFGTLARQAQSATSGHSEFSAMKTSLLVIGVLCFGLLTWQLARIIRTGAK